MATSTRNIVLTGFMGTGKSTVGRLLALKLDRTFIDTDEEIVRRVGISIAEIFERDGEKGFRLMERELCRYLGANSNLVIATGGGTLVDDGNREIMLASGFVVCLNATTQSITQRLAGFDNRPLFKSDWQALLQKRRAAYATIPYQVDTTDKTPEQIAQEIIALWQKTFA